METTRSIPVQIYDRWAGILLKTSTAFELQLTTAWMPVAAPCLAIEGVRSIARQDMPSKPADMSAMTLLLTETCGALYVCRNSSAVVKSAATA